MTDSFPIKATIKSGGGYDAPWLTVDAANPDDLNAKVQGLLAADSVAAVIELANAFKAANNAAPLAPQGQEAQQAPAPQQAASPWGAPAAQPQQPVQQQAPQQQSYGGGGRGQAQLHPEGKQCHCGQVLEFKTTGNGKKKWQCGQWRWNGGNPNDHAVEWVNG